MTELRFPQKLGWVPFFQQQITLAEHDECQPARVTEQHRSEVEIYAAEGAAVCPITASMPLLTVGDWILVSTDGRFQRLLERKTSFRRRAAGSAANEQILAANVDTAFVLCSLNADFNLNRIERYLSLIHEAGAEPVIVLSKVDLCDDPQSYQQQVQSLDNSLCVVSINALDADSSSILQPWCRPGNTIVLLGSSGVGKSTLANTLRVEAAQDTGAIREDDGKGRHTTTRRSLLMLPTGAMLIDTPGLRELQMTDFDAGIAATFADIKQLARHCRFSDCGHETEPDCAVKKAIADSRLQPRRLQNYLKLKREQGLYESTIAERRAADRALGKFYKRTMAESRKIKGEK